MAGAPEGLEKAVARTPEMRIQEIGMASSKERGMRHGSMSQSAFDCTSSDRATVRPGKKVEIAIPERACAGTGRTDGIEKEDPPETQSLPTESPTESGILKNVP
ncbi:MAG: hypothetical protein WCI02_18820 [Planctomycetota bacterium]|jgi:hypothetical protein